MILLSILICTVPQRKEFLRRLCNILYTQISDSKWKDNVEIIVYEDDFKISVGEKRNRLLGLANGEYTCFIDDDDTIVDTYIENLLPHLEESKYDCIGWKYKFIVGGRQYGPDGICGLQVAKLLGEAGLQKWCESEILMARPIGHLNPIKRSITSSVQFFNINRGEDAIWSDEVSILLKNEYFVDIVMYEYQAYPYYSIATRKENIENFKDVVFTDFDFEKMRILCFNHIILDT